MRIKLLKPHRHQGTSYLVGDIIDTDLDTANYLANLKVAAVHVSDPPALGTTPIKDIQGTSEVNKSKESPPTIKPIVPIVSSFGSANPPTGIMPEIVKT